MATTSAKPVSISRGESKSTRTLAGTFTATFYTPNCVGCTGITASGAKATPGVTIAVDTRYWKLGTKFYIEGFGYVVAQDTGGAIKGRNKIDICVSTKEEARKLGVQQLRVWVIE